MTNCTWGVTTDEPWLSDRALWLAWLKVKAPEWVYVESEVESKWVFIEVETVDRTGSI